MFLRKSLKVVILFFVVISSYHASGQVRLPRIIRDSMILQRDAKVNIWGWAPAGEKINLQLSGRKYKTVAGADGKWNILLSPSKAGGPFTISINASNQIVLKDIWFGDVWLCSGQSNMVHQMEVHKDRYAADIARAAEPQIRQFWIPTLTDLQGPRDDLPAGYWKPADTANIRQFSAVAYFFAKKLYDRYHVPIGLINASVGGTPIEAWTSENGLKEFSSVIKIVEKNKDSSYVNDLVRTAYAKNAARRTSQDKGLMEAKRWYDTSYIPADWRNIIIPGYWEDAGVKNLHGIVWYRKTIYVPEFMTGIVARLSLGRIVDADYIYINGALAGTTSYQYPQRRYVLPAGLLKAGKNSIVIKVVNYTGKGGFVPDKPYSLSAGQGLIDLKGEWQYKVGEVFTPEQLPVPGFAFQLQPAALYNAMIAPLIKYTIKGINWYQGESNANNASDYQNYLPALIADWRKQWQRGDIPFLYVQLPGFGDMEYQPAQSSWALLREGQLRSLSVANTGMAVAIDLGEWNDIHPDRKKEVGERLALAAEKLAYGETLVYSGPIYKLARIDGNKIIISFANTGSGLITNDGQPLGEIAIAGADKKFRWATSTINGDELVVWNDAVTAPMYVRYAWADNPVNPNLYNKEGLPASPFRTGE